ncbi:MAG: FHA domain-containing protein [Oscillospiraceae bacterium]|nr:FHA domain-containing protein [Oscillospiraceae bacterium]
MNIIIGIIAAVFLILILLLASLIFNYKKANRPYIKEVTKDDKYMEAAKDDEWGGYSSGAYGGQLPGKGDNLNNEKRFYVCCKGKNPFISPKPEWADGNQIVTLHKGTTVFGRREPSDVIIDDNLISRTHFEISIEIENDLCSIIDLGSSNGTFVNGNRIQDEKQYLFNGDVIVVGRTSIVFRAIEEFIF